MITSMRHPTSKLSQLVHKQKSYSLHLNSLDKIMSKTSKEVAQRSERLAQLKNRKIKSFRYTQDERKKDICNINSILFTKIIKQNPLKKIQSNDEFELLQGRIEERVQPLEKKIERSFVLRNHRQSPIHKSTYLQRSRQNIRLAKKIVQPLPTYKTSLYQKIYETKKALRERIMKYEPNFSRTKADIYVTRKMNSSWTSKNSILGSERSLSKLNPETNFQTQKRH